jgi:hypothetical protein
MRRILILCGWFFLASCTSQSVQITPSPTIQVVSVRIDPAAAMVVDAIRVCSESLPQLAVSTSIQPAQLDNLNPSTLIIMWNETGLDGHEAHPIASDKLLVIVNPDNPISSLRREQLLEIYLQEQKSWTVPSGASQEISLWAYIEDDPVQKAFESVLSDIPLKFRSVNIAPDPKAMVATIKSDPNALGFIPRSWLVDGIKELTITPPLMDSYPILAILPDQMNDPSRSLVGCLQAPTGQKPLMNYYNN